MKNSDRFLVNKENFLALPWASNSRRKQNICQPGAGIISERRIKKKIVEKLPVDSFYQSFSSEFTNHIEFHLRQYIDFMEKSLVKPIKFSK